MKPAADLPLVSHDCVAEIDEKQNRQILKSREKWQILALPPTHKTIPRTQDKIAATCASNRTIASLKTPGKKRQKEKTIVKGSRRWDAQGRNHHQKTLRTKTTKKKNSEVFFGSLHHQEKNRREHLPSLQRVKCSLIQRARSSWSHSVPPAFEILAALHPNDLIAASVYDQYSIGPSLRPICTRWYLTMNNMIQVCSNSHWVRVFTINTSADGIDSLHTLEREGTFGPIQADLPLPYPWEFISKHL